VSVSSRPRTTARRAVASSRRTAGDSKATPTRMDTALRLEGVSKAYVRGRESVLAVDGVDLELQPGEFVALIGPSGSGKSTLLHLAGALDVPDEGRVVIGDREVHSLGAGQRAELRRKEIGFIFQFFHLMPTLSVKENVMLPLLFDGVRNPERASELIERVGLAHRESHLPSELSGGEMQRAAIARALIARPKLILADEPTGNLDSATAAHILDLLLSPDIKDPDSSMLLVTHDSAVAAIADRVVSVRDGRLA
jgi:putative ABC transport system ATP-binding protein